MEEYRRKLEKDIVWDKVIFVVFLFLAIVAFISTARVKWGSGIGGGFLAACFTSARRIKESKELLKDEEKLKKHYIEAHDERLEKIRLEANRMTLGIVLIVISIAVVILMLTQAMGPILYTLLAVLIFMVVVLLIVHAVYSRLM